MFFEHTHKKKNKHKSIFSHVTHPFSLKQNPNTKQKNPKIFPIYSAFYVSVCVVIQLYTRTTTSSLWFSLTEFSLPFVRFFYCGRVLNPFLLFVVFCDRGSLDSFMERKSRSRLFGLSLFCFPLLYSICQTNKITKIHTASISA